VTDLLSESPAQRAISVSELNRQARNILESGLAKLWVEGEISNLARPASGHLYFSLKDESAQLRCAFFRQRQRGPTIRLENGDQVLIFGRVSIYEARGDYQMIVEQIEDAGEGELRRRFEALKKKLAAEGLFDEADKQDIPTLPRRIGIVTSPSGAAVRDVLTVLRRRFPAIPVMIYPAAVQGVAAIPQLTAALEAATQRNECDVIIITRGGGSLEDLWAFNEEALARAIHACPVPIVSAVGHEIDFTIADFVADLRAPTPSGAAEIVVPDQAEWMRTLVSAATRVESLSRRYLEDRFQRVDWLSKRLSQSSPGAAVARQKEWVKNLQQLMNAAMRHGLSVQARQLDAAKARLMRSSPAIDVQRSIGRLGSARQNLLAAGAAVLERRKTQLRLAQRALNSVSPLATLDRGYAIVVDDESGKILSDAADVVAGSTIRARLAKGAVKATVTETSVSADE
jgi:exodeoxyribonuclease VII large subunit